MRHHEKRDTMDMQLKKTNELSTRELIQIYIERVKVFVVEQNCVYQKADEADFDARHVIVKDGDQIVAYARILDNEQAIQIGRVVVVKEYRGRGLSTQMMTFILKSIDHSKPTRLSAQTYIKHMYESVGFKTISDEYLEDDIPHVDMQLTEFY